MKNAMKTLGLFIAAMIAVVALALWNAEKVGITQEQFWGFMKLQIMWIWGLSLLVLAIGWISHVVASAIATKDIAKVKEVHKKKAADWDL